MSNKPNITPKAPSVKMAVQVMEMSDGAIKIDTDRPDYEPWEIGNLLLGTVNLIYQGLKPEQKIANETCRTCRAGIGQGLGRAVPHIVLIDRLTGKR